MTLRHGSLMTPVSSRTVSNVATKYAVTDALHFAPMTKEQTRLFETEVAVIEGMQPVWVDEYYAVTWVSIMLSEGDWVFHIANVGPLNHIHPVRGGCQYCYSE
mgnify:CR=1 FL=1